MSIRQQERVPYETEVRNAIPNNGIWDYLRYEQGYLCLNGLRFVDLVAASVNIDQEGGPLTIIYTPNLERRAQEFRTLADQVVHQQNYSPGYEVYYATKANRLGSIVHTAIRTGLGIETSSTQDLKDLRFLEQSGLLPNKPSIICNGYKDQQEPLVHNDGTRTRIAQAGVTFQYPDRTVTGAMEIRYAKMIQQMKDWGYAITPVLDESEIQYFDDEGTYPIIDVGLRLKFGKVTSRTQLNALINRFGLTVPQLKREAVAIAQHPRLRLNMLHTMVGAAENVPIDQFLSCLSFAADQYVELKQAHPSLEYLNIGGGIPPKSEGYDYEQFLTRLFEMLNKKATEAGITPPKVVFELGSYLATETSFYIFDVLKQFRNPQPWVIVQGNLMNSLPDMFVAEKDFMFLAADHGDLPSRNVRIGDMTCDTDGIYPPRRSDKTGVSIPDTRKRMHLVVPAAGAYQRQLGGKGGAWHCGSRSSAEMTVVKYMDGKLYAWAEDRLSDYEMREASGYTTRALANLRNTL